MQVKCCGDTLVRHTRVSGFNSPHLLHALAALRVRRLSWVWPNGKAPGFHPVDVGSIPTAHSIYSPF